MRKRQKKKLTRKQRRIKNRVTIRTLFLLAITLIFNTYAWFLYITTVSANLTVHVEAWHVQFKVDDEVVERDFPITIEHAYPGMTDEERTVTIVNDGEKVADITYAVKSLRVFNNVYVATDQFETGETIPVGATQTTSTALLSKIQNDYPFEISITSSSNSVGTQTEESLTVTFSWAYESGDDSTDTTYGENAYSYYQSNSSSPAIELVVKLFVTQQED